MRRLLEKPYEQYLNGLTGENSYWCLLCPTDIGSFPYPFDRQHFIDVHHCMTEVPLPWSGPIFYKQRVLR